MAVGFVLLSRMGAGHLDCCEQSLYLVVLGAGIGMCMQVLVLIVQNTVDFADLGVATSGVTFFRTIGSSFGAAVFGSLFNNFLHDAHRRRRWPPAARRPQAAQSPHALHQLPPEMAAPIASAYADSLDQVFLCAAPVAVVGFVVGADAQAGSVARERGRRRPTWARASRCRPPTRRSSCSRTAVGRLVRQSPEIRLRSIAGTRGCESDVALLWALIQIYRQSQVFGSARLSDMAERLRVPPEVLEPTFDRLVECGHALRTGDQLWLTQSGARQVDATIRGAGQPDRRQAGELTEFRGPPGPRPRSRPRWRRSPSGCWCSATGTTTGPNSLPRHADTVIGTRLRFGP